MENIVETNIVQILEKNGYPEKKVSLPYKAIFESCKKHEVKLADVLKNLKEQKEIQNEIQDEKILFYSKAIAEAQEKQEAAKESGSSEDLFGFSPDLAAKAFEKLGLTPEKIKEFQTMYEGLSPDQKKDILKTAKNQAGIDPTLDPNKS